MAENPGGDRPLDGTLILASEYESESEDLGGRPRLYDSPRQFEERLAEVVLEHHEKHIPLTLTRLVLAMGFSSIQAFDNYRAYEGFLEVVQKARTIVMVSYEDAVLLAKNSSAARILGAMDAQNFNPTIKLDTPGESLPHEDRLAHLR